MSDTIEAPVLGKVRSRHVGMARGAVFSFLRKQAGEGREVSVSLTRLARVVKGKLRSEGFGSFDLEDGKYAARKALAQLVKRGDIEIIPQTNAHGMKLPPVYRLKGE